MGLDQYATARKGEPFLNEEGFNEYPESKELAYWRKHPNLQGWMEKLYRAKGGEGEFNCVSVELSEEDLDSLEKAITEQQLPSTQGFFFGGESDDYYKEHDLKFVSEARDAINEGYTVVYSSWW
jgi:hypothetical protein